LRVTWGLQKTRGQMRRFGVQFAARAARSLGAALKRSCPRVESPSREADGRPTFGDCLRSPLVRSEGAHRRDATLDAVIGGPHDAPKGVAACAETPARPCRITVFRPDPAALHRVHFGLCKSKRLCYTLPRANPFAHSSVAQR